MRHLTICNVGPIERVDIELSRFNFFIGPQSSGKSTIAKVLSTCMWLEKEAATTLTEHLTYSSEDFIALIEGYHKIQGYLSDVSIIDYETESVVLHYDKVHGLNVDLKEGINYRRKKISYIPAERSAITLPELQGFEFGESSMRSFLFDWYSARESYNSEHKVEILNLDMKYYYDESEKKYKDRVEHSNGKTYEISLSNASSGLQAVTTLQLMVEYYAGQYFQEYGKKTAFEDRDKDKILRRRLTDKLVLSKLYPGFQESQRDEFVQEANQKYREGEVLHVELVKEFKDRHNQLAVPALTSFVVEEPEENLYPYSQIALLELMVQYCQNGRGHELVVTTHSPYLINYLNVLLRRPKDKIHIDIDDIQVWAVNEGKLFSLKATDDETKEQLIDTYELSEPMADIFSEFKHLGK